MQNKLCKIFIYLCFIAAFIFAPTACDSEDSPSIQAAPPTNAAVSSAGETRTPEPEKSTVPSHTASSFLNPSDTAQATLSPAESSSKEPCVTEIPSTAAEQSSAPSTAAPTASLQPSVSLPAASPNPSASAAIPSPSQAAPSPTVVIDIKETSAPGNIVYSGNGCYLDASNASDGYVMVKYTGSGTKRIKVQIIADATYNYDLNLNGSFEAFPLQMGSGSYRIRFMQNTTGSSYRELYSFAIEVSLSDANTPYLYPNQQVNYNKNSEAVKKSFELCSGKSSEADKVKAIYSYVTDNIDYDYDLAEKINSGQVSIYVPDVDSILSSKKGICYDYAALTAAMLRAQGIPTMLVMGYVKPNNAYHAWNLIYLQNSGWVAVNIYFDGQKWNLADTTYAASGGSDIVDFIKNTNNYTTTKWY